MEYREIKDEEVSLLGFGCMRFPVNDDGSIDEITSFAMLDTAYYHGVNYYDTAFMYHEEKSEPFVGRWLKTKDREELYLATKLPMWSIYTLEEAKATFALQFERLQVDYIDFYLLHALDKKKWERVKDQGILEYLQEQKSQGKINYLGFSFHDDYQTFEEIIKAYPWDFCQIQLNYVDDQVQAGSKGLALAKDLGIAVVIMEPVKGGLLAGLPDKEKTILDSADDAATLAIRWVASQEGVSVILSGMSSMDQVEANIATLSEVRVCSEEEKQKLALVAKSLQEKVLVPCTNCAYCLPCEFNVDIPACFKYLNVAARYENPRLARRNYEINVGEKRASNCQACGVCKEKCPQQIDIPTVLQEVAAKLED